MNARTHTHTHTAHKSNEIISWGGGEEVDNVQVVVTDYKSRADEMIN